MTAGIYADCNLGLTFGKPIITKLAGNWVVIVTSGYNNANGVLGDGGGYVYVLDALTGEMKQKIATGVGSATTPSGLAQINNYVDNVDIDNTTLRAYGGDVLGNIWRFDFVAGTATRLGTAKDASNNVQPITIRPELAELDGKPFVLVGTGKYLGGSDVTDGQRQSVYGIKDPLTGSSPIYADPLRGSLRPMRSATWPRPRGAVRAITCTGLRWRLLPHRLGARPSRGRRARQRRDEAVPRRPGLHQQRSGGDPVQRRRPQLVQPGRLPHRRGDPRHRELGVPRRFAQRRLQRAGTGCASGRRQPETDRRTSPERRQQHHQALDAAGAPAGRQADQLARDHAVASMSGGVMGGTLERPAGFFLPIATIGAVNARRLTTAALGGGGPSMQRS